mmetsp:Transcript_55593/g.129425  ORF Transcript_55593/g.129425 Transcript_55593/m.129425 type:complete len:157 (+) Transcript_55593:73-543(+)
MHKVWGGTELDLGSSDEGGTGSDSSRTRDVDASRGHLLYSTSSSNAGDEPESDTLAENVALDESKSEEAVTVEGPWSIGSMQHEGGTCKPCYFACSAVGCRNGIDCRFCHFSHRGMNRPRPAKVRRALYKKIIEKQLREAQKTHCVDNHTSHSSMA